MAFAALLGCALPPASYIIVNGQASPPLTRSHAEAQYLINGLFGPNWDQYDKPPKLLHAELPRYPDAARRADAEGPVECIVTIAPSGGVSHVQVTRAPHALLAEEVERAARNWIFEPFLRKGVPVEARVRFRYLYRLE